MRSSNIMRALYRPGSVKRKSIIYYVIVMSGPEARGLCVANIGLLVIDITVYIISSNCKVYLLSGYCNW